MTALYIILGIIAFICLVLLVKVRIDAEYIDGFKLSVSWLFLHFSIYPKPQKEKKPLSPKRKNPKKKSRKSPQRKNPKSPISLKPSMKTRVWTV